MLNETGVTTAYTESTQGKRTLVVLYVVNGLLTSVRCHENKSKQQGDKLCGELLCVKLEVLKASQEQAKNLHAC